MRDTWTELLARANRASRRVFGNQCRRGIDADDAAQQWVVRQWRRGGVDMNWAYHNARRDIKTVARQCRYRSTRSSHWLADQMPPDEPGTQHDDHSDLHEAIMLLPREEREVVVGWMAHGCRTNLAARSMGPSTSTWYRRWNSALAMLRIILEGDTDAR